jgi:biopolymer transport protein TolR
MINVTPLVDVCLVLLIIFFAVTEKMTPGKDVHLPRAANIGEVDDGVVVSVARAGKIWWDLEPLADASALRERAARGRVSVVKADEELPYESIYPVLIAVHDAGATTAHLAVRR